jgi:hypothetical protein
MAWGPMACLDATRMRLRCICRQRMGCGTRAWALMFCMGCGYAAMALLSVSNEATGCTCATYEGLRHTLLLVCVLTEGCCSYRGSSSIESTSVSCCAVLILSSVNAGS